MPDGRLLGGRVVLVTGDRLGLADRLRARGAVVASLAGPFADLDAVRAAFGEVATREGRIDVVVHADLPPAALTATPLAECTEPHWDAHAEAPLRAALHVCRAAFPHLRERGGRIVLLTPTAGLVGEAGFVALTTATEGLRALAKTAARQWGAHRITVNCVAPSLALCGAAVPAPVDPPALERDATLDDLADAVALLAGEAAGSITGVTIPVDGGVVMAS